MRAGVHILEGAVIDSDPRYRQDDADELHRVSKAMFGGWRGTEDGGASDRVPGVLERLDRMELILKYAVAAAGAIGALIGSLLTVVVQGMLLPGHH